VVDRPFVASPGIFASRIPHLLLALGMHLITLTTDFGTSDWFVGTMKGVMLGINPRARIVNLTHGVPAGDIRAGAFALAAACKFFPKGTVHVAVVDPGVGSEREAIAVETERYRFVSPDNGVLWWALRNETIRKVRALKNERYFLRELSKTFHGRDIFAPVAAHLSRGVPIEKLGPSKKEFVRLEWPEPRINERSIEGEVIYIDRFGNAITNLGVDVLRALDGRRLEVFVRGKRRCSVEACYAAVQPGKPVAVFGSSGFLEIAVNGGSAEKNFGLKAGTRISVRLAPVG
jgi:S-adenosylmethionine hydrolase